MASLKLATETTASSHPIKPSASGSAPSASNASKVNPPAMPRDNWEVAYIYAFLSKFTSLRDLELLTTIMYSPLDFEAALLTSSPSKVRAPSTRTKRSHSQSSSTSSLSSLSDIDDDEPATLIDVPAEPSDLMVLILKTLHGLSGEATAKKTSWYEWLSKWELERIQAEDYLLGNKRLLAGEEGEKAFWNLSWSRKAHFLRAVVDYLLTYAPSVREILISGYDGQNQRVVKRTADKNPLILEGFGNVHRRTVWAIDNSPRLYLSGSPYKATHEWTALCDTLDEYKAYIATLAPPKVSKSKATTNGSTTASSKTTSAPATNGKPTVEGSGDPFSKAKEAAAKNREKQADQGRGKEKAALGASASSGKGKAKAEEKDDEALAKEREVRAKLEARLPLIEADQQAILDLAEKKIKAIEKAQERDARVARQLARLGNYSPVNTRERRLRTTAKVDYTFADGDNDDEHDDGGYEDEEGTRVEGSSTATSEAGGRGTKRTRGEGGSDEEGLGGRSRRAAPPPVPYGARRSNRVQLRENADEDEQDSRFSTATASRAPSVEELGSTHGANGVGLPAEREDAMSAVSPPATAPAPAESIIAEHEGAGTIQAEQLAKSEGEKALENGADPMKVDA